MSLTATLIDYKNRGVKVSRLAVKVDMMSVAPMEEVSALAIPYK